MSTIVRVCARCGQHTDHSLPRPSGRDPVEWDAYISDACVGADGSLRLEDAVVSGVSPTALLAAQQARTPDREAG